jgi:hypothetical protein
MALQIVDLACSGLKFFLSLIVFKNEARQCQAKVLEPWSPGAVSGLALELI